MENNHNPNDTKLSRSRLEALVDGIFAFAMTLLVTGLVIPSLPPGEAAAELPGRLTAMRPEFFSFLIAFFVLSSFWLVHHRQFHFVRSVDPWIMRITLFILAGVVLMPFTTNVSGDYSNLQIAADLFHVNMFSLGLLFLVHWWYLTRHPALTSVPISRSEAVHGIRRALVVPFISAFGLLVSFIEPSLSMAVYLLLFPSFLIIERYDSARPGTV